MNYAARLEKALARAGMNQSELAREIRVKPQAIQYLCSGKAIGSKYTAAIASVLNINAKWLENGKGEMFNQGQTRGVNEKRALYSEEDEDLLKRIHRLPEAQRARLPKIIDALNPKLDKSTGD